MKAILRHILVGVAALSATGTAASAADLDAPLYEQVPEITPVEIGSGWYLRGDVGYGLKTEIESSTRHYFQSLDEDGNYFDPALYDYSKSKDGSFDMDGGAEFGVGMGYQFNEFLRGDLTAKYWKHDISASASSDETCLGDVPVDHDTYGATCRSQAEGSATAWDLMANAYVDLGTISGITPYVGGGIGAVQLKYDDISTTATCLKDGSECGEAFQTTHQGAEDWRFAYALMAGASYDLTPSLKLDIGYRYLNVDGGDMYDFAADDATNGASGVQTADDGFDRHSIQAGIRYSLF